MKMGGEIGSYTNTFKVRVTWVKDRWAHRRYASLDCPPFARTGRVEVVEPKAGGEAWPVKVGDVFKIEVKHG